MSSRLARALIFPQSVILEKLSDYFAKRDDAVEYEGCVAHRGRYSAISDGKGGMAYCFIRTFTESEIRETFSLLNRIDDKYRISECLQMLTAFLAHPFGGERITKKEATSSWDWRW